MHSRFYDQTGSTNLFITNGYNGAGMDSSVLLDISGQGRTCTNPTKYRVRNYSPATNVRRKTGEPVVCGGSSNDDCYYYNFQSKVWTWLAAYSQGGGAGGVELSNGSFWILGGNNAKIRTSLIFDGVDSLSPGPNLPDDFHRHVTLDHTIQCTRFEICPNYP